MATRVTSGKPGRATATHRRKGAILDAALECFSTLGYDQTTLADIRERADASTGSIYHHFGSKDQIAASLYLDGVRQTQTAGLEALLRTRTARTGIASQVAAYIDWVVANPDFARFLFAMRHAPFVESEDPAIDDLNQDVYQGAARWLNDRVDAGELPELEPAIRWAIVFGPCRHWAGSLAQRSSAFSFSSCFNRARSSLVKPGRWPASVSARRTQWRSVSWLIDSFAEIDSIAFHCDGYSSWWSKTIRTARSRTSAGYGGRERLLRSDIAPSSQGLEQSPIPGRSNPFDARPDLTSIWSLFAPAALGDAPVTCPWRYPAKRPPTRRSRVGTFRCSSGDPGSTTARLLLRSTRSSPQSLCGLGNQRQPRR